MADNIESRLQALRTQQQEASRRHAQAEAKLDAVRDKRTQILKSLESQGFSSAEEARERVESLSTEVEAILSRIEEKVSGL